ncbi:chemotaxis protein CheW [Gorillibacterium sp. CAU 1737]|uniref:chemotaxis protein CheW n=1 Tax=Gorillibacterium sp. CAU 1737 TaxID=3140362 RepID=UPI0032608787
MSEEIKVIVFKLGAEEYGVEVEKVETIERIQHLTRVPKTPPFIKGVMNLRGVVVPVLDLRGRFNLEETAYTDASRIIIIAIEDLKVGMIVDSADDVIDVDTDTISDPPEIVGGVKAKYLRGVARVGEDRLLILLNLKEVLNKGELIQLEELEE